MSDVRTIEDIFGEYIELRTVRERNDYLKAIGDQNPQLQDQLEKLIAAHGAAGSFLDVATDSIDVVTEHSPSDLIGTQIGPYKLLQQLGEGGMGVVFMAERQRPVKQRVALKIIKHGMDSKKFIARFEAERQALAMMDHPHIAKVLDAGCTESGRPYFVMELVKGIPISQYCDENKLTTRQRLQLFIPVCQAVHHAHQKGIIHRDLKPSNVMVTQYDDKAVPKVIDFGVAKAMNQQLTERTLFTEVGSIMGTWEYMSPEQAVLNQLDVDTRSDVYSLGVMLYELLTGETPLDRQRLRGAQLLETLRMIREEEPPRPSTRISSLSRDRATARAAYLRTKPESLTSEIRGDLDWIIMKALSKERARRYDSANRFAEDVQRFLQSEPIEARAPSLVYRAKKLWQRNRVLATAATAAVLVIALASGNAIQSYLVQAKLVSRLKDQNQRLAESGFEKIFEYAQAGQTDAARRILADLETNAGDESEQNLLISRNIVKIFGNEQERSEAREAFVQLDNQGQSLVVKSLLVMSYIETGREWEYWRTAHLLNAFEPTTFEEHLFRGAAYIWGASEKAVVDLRQAVIMRPQSPIAHAMYSRALCQAAMEYSTDLDGRIENTSEALAEASAGVRFSAPGNVFAVGAELDAYAGLYQLYMFRGDNLSNPAVQRCLSAWRARAVEVLVLPYDSFLHSRLLNSLMIWQWHHLDVDPQFQRAVLEMAEDESPDAEVITKLVQQYYRAGDLEKCAELVRRHRDLVNGFDLLVFLPSIELMYLESQDIQKIRGYVRSLIAMQDAEHAHLSGAMNWSLLRLVGENSLAKEGGKRFLDFVKEIRGGYADTAAMIPVAEYLSDFERQSIAVDPNSELVGAKTFTWFRLAIDQLISGNRDEAYHLFDLITQEPRFEPFIHEWSRIFKDRLRNDDWLPWLPSSVGKNSPNQDTSLPH